MSQLTTRVRLLQERRRHTPRRSSLEVRMEVLSAVYHGKTRPTQIMYQSNTSWAILRYHLSVLEASELVKATRTGLRSEYAITQKGADLVRSFVGIRTVVGKDAADLGVFHPITNERMR